MHPRKFAYSEVGKVDFAGAAAYVASLPADTRARLSKPDTEILTWVFFLIAKRAQGGGTGTYNWHSREFLASKIHRSVRTVSRSLRKLTEYGLLERIRRRAIKGVWQTTLTKLGPVGLKTLYARCFRKTHTFQPRAKNVPQGPLREYMKKDFTAPPVNPNPSPPVDGGYGAKPSRVRWVEVVKNGVVYMKRELS